jgi:hypothetical protein
MRGVPDRISLSLVGVAKSVTVVTVTASAYGCTLSFEIGPEA